MGLHPLVLAKNGLRAFPARVQNQKFKLSTTSIMNAKEKDADKEVIFNDVGDEKGLITLNRPKQLNTLNVSMVCKIRETLLKWKDKKQLIAIKGAGDKAFCAGGDVVAVVKDKSGEVGRKFFREEYKADALISSLKIPYVAFINGIVMGGGVGISIFGSHRIATETSMFAMPETQIGLFPDVGVSYKLARMPHELGNFLALTGYRLRGYDLVHAGIATHYCSQENLRHLHDQILCDFGKSFSGSLDDILNEFQEKSFEGGKAPKFSLEEHLQKIETWFSECTVEEIIEKISQDESPFSSEILTVLKKMSPISLKVTLRQIREAGKMEIFDCFNMDYRIAVKMLKCGDFEEGVRALLIDKDKKPKWYHEELSFVGDEEVEEFFTPLSEPELDLPASLEEPCKD